MDIRSCLLEDPARVPELGFSVASHYPYAVSVALSTCPDSCGSDVIERLEGVYGSWPDASLWRVTFAGGKMVWRHWLQTIFSYLRDVVAIGVTVEIAGLDRRIVRHVQRTYTDIHSSDASERSVHERDLGGETLIWRAA
ncbi:MAG: hypothetical protein V3V08_25300 [Nannocystaceae bacterium]